MLNNSDVQNFLDGEHSVHGWKESRFQLACRDKRINMFDGSKP